MNHQEHFGQVLKKKLLATGKCSEYFMKGYSAEEIDAVMRAQGLSYLPRYVREYYEVMGHEELLNIRCASQWAYDDVLEIKDDLGEVMREYKVPVPETMFVFFTHQRSNYFYVEVDGNENPAVYGYQEEDSAPLLVSETFEGYTELLLASWRKFNSREFI